MNPQQLLIRNIQRRLWDFSILLGGAAANRGHNRKKAVYLRSAIMLLASAIEGVIYHIIELHSRQTNPILFSKDTLKEVQQLAIPGVPIGTRRNDLYLAQKVKEDFCLNTPAGTFKVMIQYLRKEGLITEREYRRLEYVRNQRKLLHVQALKGVDRGYTMRTVNLLIDALDMVVTKMIQI